jgi:hypothetical protein
MVFAKVLIYFIYFARKGAEPQSFDNFLPQIVWVLTDFIIFNHQPSTIN